MSKHFDTKIQRIKEQIGDNKVKEAFRRLAFLMEEFAIPMELQVDLYTIKNEFSLIEKERMVTGSEGSELFSRRQNQVKRLLTLVGYIRDWYETNGQPNKNDRSAGRANASGAPRPMRRSFLKAEEVTKAYEGFQLQSTSLELFSGEITAVVGKNASGKSTLLRLLAGIEKADTGTLEYFNQSKVEDWYQLKKQIGYIPQDLKEKKLKLEDILRVSCILRGIPKKDIDFQLEDVINKLNLEEEIKKSWNDLSGGYKMRFELAKTLIWRPRLLILDEPMANLDILAQRHFLHDLRAYADSAQHPISILISSQHIEAVESIADTVTFLEAGQVTFSGRLSELGRDRPFNIFELGTVRQNHHEAIKHLQTFDDRIIIGEFLDIITLNVPLDIELIELMNFLEKKSIMIRFVRDITFSTRQFFK